jgi:hypothetical protein
VSRTAASKIRSGQLVPHVRHWGALADLGRELALLYPPTHEPSGCLDDEFLPVIIDQRRLPEMSRDAR